jgi:hypothetical protein
MSNPLYRYGTITGLAAGDARITIGGKGRKNILAITATYQVSTVVAPGVAFQGRLIIMEGQINPLAVGFNTPQPIPPDFPANTNFYNLGKVLFDAPFSDVGPHAFFYPIAQLEGSPQSDEDSTLNVILCIGHDSAAGVYIPTLVVSGQTTFGSQIAGAPQQAFIR